MEVFATLAAELATGKRLALCTVIRTEGSSPRKAGTHMLVYPDGAIVGTIGGGTIELKVIERAQQALEEGRPALFSAHLTRDLAMCCGGAMEVYIEPLSAAPPLLLFGAGHVSQALCGPAAACGFAVTVVDDREEFNTEGRFPDAAARRVEDPVGALPHLPTGPQSYGVIVTHSHALDEELLRGCLAYPWAYLGMIGSQAKVARFVARLIARGVPEEKLLGVHMPIGLDIGAQSPAEIAVSVLAELVQVRRLGATSAAAAQLTRGAAHRRGRPG